MVTMCRASLRLISPSIAASVVDFPDPVGPQTRTSPRVCFVSSLITGGRFSSATVGIAAGSARIAAAIVAR